LEGTKKRTFVLTSNRRKKTRQKSEKKNERFLSTGKKVEGKVFGAKGVTIENGKEAGESRARNRIFRQLPKEGGGGRHTRACGWKQNGKRGP